MTQRECAYCKEALEFCGRFLTRWGMADGYACTEHGIHFVMTDPMKVEGSHITPVEGQHVEA